jgi:murein DD-endopeptidase MepM/ murein hydrolase activator NlpD
MIKYRALTAGTKCGCDARGDFMIFLDNSGARYAPSTGKNLTVKKSVYKKVISSGLLAVILFSATMADLAAADASLTTQALAVATSLPQNHPTAPRKSDIEEVAEATISSVKGVYEMMKQAQELSAMLPSNRRDTQVAAPKSNLDIAISIAARVPELPIPQPEQAVASKPVTPAPKPSPAPQPPNNNRPAQNTAPRTSAAAALPGSKSLIWPVDGLIYSGFNSRRGRRIHGAVDIVARRGTPIAAVADGIVSVAANGGRDFAGYGKTVILDHGNGLFTLYAHCDTILVKMGQRVKQGEYIATVGRTGRATTYHCHFEVRIAGRKYDPLAYLPSRPEVVRIRR